MAILFHQPTAAPRRTVLLLAVSLTLVLGACANTFDATSVGVEATMAAPAGATPQGEPFRVSSKAVYFLGGVLPVSKPSLAKALNHQVTSTQHVENLRIRVRSRWSDLLITVLTAGLVVPRTVTYEGVVVGQ